MSSSMCPISVEVFDKKLSEIFALEPESFPAFLRYTLGDAYDESRLHFHRVDFVIEQHMSDGAYSEPVRTGKPI